MNRAVVVDASALVELLCQTGKAPTIAARLKRASSLHAPHLIDVEVTSALRRQCSLKALSSSRESDALADLGDFPLTRHVHLSLLGRVWELRNRFSAYDAFYLALTEALDASLVTCDGKLAEAGRHVDVV